MDYKKIMIIALMVLLAVLSFTVIAPRAADPANHKHSIEQTEDKIASVMTLSGGAAATSATLSLLPGDMCTPLAEQLAELAKYFLLILSALYLEKFLISLSGYITFAFLIPIACICVCIAVAAGKKNLTRTAARIALIGLIIFFIVPASVMLSDKVFGLTRNEKLEKDVRKNPDDYIDLPNEYEIDEIGMMDTYIENFPESELKEELRDTLVGRSPHQKFEEKLKAIELWDDWVQYRAGEYDWIARKWAADNGLTIVE